MTFEWDKSLETGNFVIDSEHKKLLEVVNDFTKACEIGEMDNVLKSFEFLLKYTKIHFSHEEDLQLKYNFPKYQEHADYHGVLISKTLELAENIKKQGINDFTLGQLRIIVDAIINHIKDDDSLIAIHIKEATK